MIEIRVKLSKCTWTTKMTQRARKKLNQWIVASSTSTPPMWPFTRHPRRKMTKYHVHNWIKSIQKERDTGPKGERFRYQAVNLGVIYPTEVELVKISNPLVISGWSHINYGNRWVGNINGQQEGEAYSFVIYSKCYSYRNTPGYDWIYHDGNYRTVLKV